MSPAPALTLDEKIQRVTWSVEQAHLELLQIYPEYVYLELEELNAKWKLVDDGETCLVSFTVNSTVNFTAKIIEVDEGLFDVQVSAGINITYLDEETGEF